MEKSKVSVAAWARIVADHLAANGGEPNENNPEKYSYGVEGKLRGKNGFGAMTLSNIMCLATYDTTTKTWDVFAETY